MFSTKTRKVIAGTLTTASCLTLLMAGVAAADAVATTPKWSDITVDGKLDEAYWAAATWTAIDKPLKKADGTTDHSDRANNVNKFATAWDADNLYIAVEVQDNILVTESTGLDTSIYAQDCVEIFVDGNNDKTATSLVDFNDLHLFLSASTNEAKGMGKGWAWHEMSEYAGVEWKIATDDDGYNVEVSIPWALLEETPAVNKEVGFLVTVNDDDDKASYLSSDRIEQYWGLDEFNSNSPSTWNTIKLEGDFKMPEPPKDDTSSDAGADTGSDNEPTTSTDTFDLTAVALAASALSAAAFAVSKKRSK